MSGELNRCPVTFTVNQEYSGQDVRFVDVYIDVMHTGDNLNFTSFTKEVIDSAVPSIMNTPILGYIRYDGDITDFKGHEHKLIVDDDGVSYVYAGNAYGVIPESCDPRWITKDDGTGTEREYLRVNGILWTKFSDSMEIFERDGKKNHSVELVDMDGCVDERGYYNVSRFEFDGCCILSTTDPEIKPAMAGSCIVADFSAKTVAGQIKEMLREYELTKQKNLVAFNKGDTGRGITMDEKLKVLKEFDISEDSLGFSLEDVTVDELREKCEEMAKKKKGGYKTQCSVTEDEQKPGDPQEAYSLGMNQKMEEICGQLCAEKLVDAWGDEVPRYSLIEATDADLIVYDCIDWKIYGLPYSMNGDNVVIDYKCKRRMKCTYEEWDDGSNSFENPMKSAYEKMTSDYAVLKKELDKCKKDYAEILPKYNQYVQAEEEAVKAEAQNKKNALFAVMDERLAGDAEYQKLKELTDMDYDTLAKECYALIGKNAMNFSYVPSAQPEKTVKFGVTGSAVNEGKYGDLFERYGKK